MAIGNQSSNKIVLEVKVAEQGKGLSETDLQNLNDFKENYSKILKVTESEEVLLANGTTIAKEELVGARGEKGETGARGERGEQGIQGAKGEDGKSAYQIWLDTGNQGSEQDFINSLGGSGLSEQEKQQLIKKGVTKEVLLADGTTASEAEIIANSTAFSFAPANVSLQVDGNKLKYKRSGDSQYTEIENQPYLADFQKEMSLQVRNQYGFLEYSFQENPIWYPFGLDAEYNLDNLSKKNLAKKIRTPFVFVEDYGADPNADDNSLAIKRAIAIAASRRAIVFICGIYKCKHIIYVPNGMTIMGIGKHVSGVINTSTFVTFGVGNDVIFRDLFIENKSQRRYAIHSRDVNAPHLSNCKINGMIYLYNETPKPLKGITMEYCDVISDFENDWNGHNDQKDAISLYGYLGSKFINNTFDTKNLNRLFKFSIGNVTQSNPYWITSENNARDIIIIGNTFKGSGGKQVIDMFNLTSGLRFVNNHLEMVDVPDSPYGWGYLINYKSPNDLRDNKDIGSAIVLDGNTGIYPGDLLKLSGCYGVNYPNYNGTNYHTVKVTNNHIKRTRMNAPHGWMHIAFYNDVILSGNTFEIPALPHACILRVSSNENVIVDNTNTFIGGNIIVDKATKDESQEIEFTGKGGDVFIAAKVHKFNTRGAVILSGDFDYQNITVDGLRSYPNVDATEYALPVYCYNVNSGMARDILVKNCDATKNGNRNVQPYYATVLKNVIREENNSWNTRMVSTDFNPGEIEVGASKSTIVNYPDVAVGDFVQATFSQYHADLEVRAVVSEANKVTVFLKNTGESQIILTSGYLIIRKI